MYYYIFIKRSISCLHFHKPLFASLPIHSANHILFYNDKSVPFIKNKLLQGCGQNYAVDMDRTM